MNSKHAITHDVPSLGGGDLMEMFAGTQNVEAIEKFEAKILEITRIHHVEKFLFLPVEELLPDPKGYKPDVFTDQRKYHKDCEKSTIKCVKLMP
jgi:hypothetical protein